MKSPGIPNMLIKSQQGSFIEKFAKKLNDFIMKNKNNL
jgi:hypothetical protein